MIVVCVAGMAAVTGCGSNQPVGPATSSAPSPQTVTALPATTTLPVGQSVDVVLEENRSTGYTWSTVPPLVKPGSQPVVTVGESRYSPGAAIPGAPGESRTTITAVSPGTAVVVFRYSPPNQQPDLKNVKRLTVVVN